MNKTGWLVSYTHSNQTTELAFFPTPNRYLAMEERRAIWLEVCLFVNQWQHPYYATAHLVNLAPWSS
jgi:hypothetical protein